LISLDFPFQKYSGTTDIEIREINQDGKEKKRKKYLTNMMFDYIYGIYTVMTLKNRNSRRMFRLKKKNRGE